MSREIAGPQWEALPESEELDVFLSILDEDSEEPEERENTTKRFDLVRSAMPLENTHPPLSGYTNDSRQSISCVLPRDAGFPKDPPDIGDWPRRLLHVPTMTSAEYTNIEYGQTAYKYMNKVDEWQLVYEPEYHAISYTWGRYILQKPKKEDEKEFRRWKQSPALDVKNITWDIPRVKAEFITVDSFQRVISAACQDPSGKPRVDFVWLDVACINQNDKYPEKNLEIGRQASIFRKAKAVVIWLHQQSSTALSNFLGSLESREHDLSRHDLSSLYDGIDWFLSDKWFSSLWTYQEAYLSQDRAWFSSRTGDVNSVVSLSQFVDFCAKLGADCEQYLASDGYSTLPVRTRDQKFIADVLEMLNKHGILALAQNSPFALYSASWGRQAQKEYDRIYGIQQVFPFRVGTSVEGSDPNATYTLFTLEAQLGRLLLEQYPVNSQLHIFEEPVMQGSGWHISPTSRIPQWGFPQPLQTYKFTRQCALSAFDKDIEGQKTVIAQYSGYIQELSSLQALWRDADAEYLAGQLNFRSVQQISLDVVESSMSVPDEKPEYRKWGCRRDDLSGNYQHQLSAWLATQASTAIITVLLLGDFDDTLWGKHYCGMLLQGKDDEMPKRRIGVCAWRGEATGSWSNWQSGTFV